MEFLPYVVKDRICYFLSSRDLENLSQACWSDSCEGHIRRRRTVKNEPPIIPIECGVSADLNSIQLRSEVDIFLCGISHYFPTLAIIYVPREIDVERRVNPAKLFPPSVHVIKLQYRIFTGGQLGGSNRDGKVMQALLFMPSNNSRISSIILQEYEDKSNRQYLLTSEGILTPFCESLYSPPTKGWSRNLQVIYEVTSEMLTCLTDPLENQSNHPNRTNRNRSHGLGRRVQQPHHRDSIQQQSSSSPESSKEEEELMFGVYWTNFVTSSYYPAHPKPASKAKINEPGITSRLRFESLNGFVLEWCPPQTESPDEHGQSLLNLSLSGVQNLVSCKSVLEKFFSSKKACLAFIPQKCENEYLQLTNQHQAKIENQKILNMLAWSQRFFTLGSHTSFQPQKIDRRNQVVTLETEILSL